MSTNIPKEQQQEEERQPLDDDDDSYLTLVPRGLHETAVDWLRHELREFRVECHFWGELPVPASADATNNTAAANKKPSKRAKLLSECCKDPVHVVPMADAPDVCVGYNSSCSNLSRIRDNNDNNDNNNNMSWCCGGTTYQSVWLLVKTNAPVHVIGKLRGPGPWLAWVGGWWDQPDTATKTTTTTNTTPSPPTGIDIAGFKYQDSLEQAVAQIESITATAQMYPLEPAVKLWQRYALANWNKNDDNTNTTTRPQQDGDDGDKQQQTIRNKNDNINSNLKQLKYRLSCWRSDTKRYKNYTRQALNTAVAEYIVRPYDKEWTVDLRNYDIEIVLLVRHQCQLAVAIALQPYQRISCKSFEPGVLPPDITPPYLSTQAVVRLRPTTAQLLLHLCQLQPGDVVMDPCVGLGTLPTEASSQRGVVGLGGDIVLQELLPDILPYVKASRKHVRGVDALLAWDASLMPLRCSTVDVVVSDLPFGQQCLSASKLQMLLPLIMAECARVLRPKTGRMVLLCGHYTHVLEALAQVQTELPRIPSASAVNGTVSNSSLWQFPCTAVFPVSIGGALAWIVQIARGDAPWEHERWIPRIRKVAAQRQQVKRHRNSGGGTKRVQA